MRWPHIKKNEAWRKIAEEFSSQKPLPRRSADQLKTFWSNSKRLAKKEVAKERRETFKTGGGPSPPSITDVTSKIVSLIPQQTEPLEFDCDSDQQGPFMKLLIDELNTSAKEKDDIQYTPGEDDVINSENCAPLTPVRENIQTGSHISTYETITPTTSNISRKHCNRKIPPLKYLRDCSEEYHEVRMRAIREESTFREAEHRLRMENLRLKNALLKEKLKRMNCDLNI